jgi:glycine cleavage system H protein
MENEQTGQPLMLSYKRARFATQLPLEFRYSPSHFWMAQQADGLWRVGMTKFATRMFGEMVDFGFEMASGAAVAPGQVVGWIEGFKAVSDLYCIGRGKFAGANPALEGDITSINRDPYGAGWIYRIEGEPGADCVDAAGYARILDSTIDALLQKPGCGPTPGQG